MLKTSLTAFRQGKMGESLQTDGPYLGTVGLLLDDAVNVDAISAPVHRGNLASRLLCELTPDDLDLIVLTDRKRSHLHIEQMSHAWGIQKILVTQIKAASCHMHHDTEDTRGLTAQ
jgi:hypothetical protein